MLGTICILVALILAAINMVTGPIIKKMEEQKVYDSLREALDGEFAPVEIPAGAPDTVTGVYRVTENGEAVGHVVTVEKQGYASTIVLTVGIKADGTVNRVVVTSQQETHGKDIKPLINGFAGVNEEGVADVEQVTGATITSKTIKDAVADAFKALSADASEGGEEEKEETLPRTDAEIEALAKELAGEDAQLESVAVENTTNVKRVYRVSGNKGYIAYTFTINERYGTIDTENLVYIGTNGAIKKIDKLTWSVSEAAPDWGYIPPTDEEMDQFYAELNGKNKDTIGDVDLATGATNTTTVLVNTITEALDVVGGLISKDMPRTDAEIEALAKELVGGDAELSNITPEGTTNVKRVYRVSGNKGYVAYTFTINDRYGTIDTENLVYIGTNGAIKKIDKLTWSVSDAAPDWGYIPPTDEEMEQFYQGLIGRDQGSIGEVDLATGATNTTTVLVGTLTEALTVVGEILKNDLPRPEAEIEALIKEMVGEGEVLVNITPADAALVKRLYRVEGGKGYVAYAVAISPNYGTVETETLIYINSQGEITDTEKIFWKVSDPAPDWGYIPPDDQRVDKLYSDFIGKNLDTVGQVDLATGATSSGERLLECITKALELVDALEGSDNNNGAATAKVDNTPRAVGIAVAVAMAVGIAAAIALPIITKRRKNG